MTRKPREDFPGALHHVCCRGIAHRSVFEGPDDVRFLVARLARCVRDQVIRIHRYCFLSTHAHFLVESIDGGLSYAMQVSLGPYVRRFNRRRGRDGPLFRGRFWSRGVFGHLDRQAVLGYIDFNAVEAGLAGEPDAYPYGAAQYDQRKRRPLWLSATCTDVRRPTKDALDLVNHRLRYGAERRDDLDWLVKSGSKAVQKWIASRCELADGTEPGLPIASPHAVLRLCRAEPRSRDRSLLETGLLRDAARLSQAEIAGHAACSRSAVQSRLAAYRRRIKDGEPLARSAASIVNASLRRLTRHHHPAPQPRRDPA